MARGRLGEGIWSPIWLYVEAIFRVPCSAGAECIPAALGPAIPIGLVTLAVITRSTGDADEFGPTVFAHVSPLKVFSRSVAPDSVLTRKRALTPSRGMVPGLWVVKTISVGGPGGFLMSVKKVAVAAAFGPAKEWPSERYVALIDRLAERYDAECVLVGAPAERQRAVDVARASGSGALIAAGETSVGEALARLGPRPCDQRPPRPRFSNNGSMRSHASSVIS